MHTQILESFGLTKKEAHVYEILLKNGPMPLLALTKKTPYKRSDLYNILESLVQWELLNVEEKMKKKWYSAVHPSRLEDMSVDQEREVKKNKKLLGDILPDLTSLYRMGNNKPGVRFFEGREGFQEALFDTLQAVETIYTFSNSEAVEKHVGDINAKYQREREKRGISKNILLLDTPSNRERVQNMSRSKYTTYKFLPKRLAPFQTALQIYNNKISYFTLRNNNLVAVIIEDPDIYKMHRNFFEFLWEFVSKVHSDDVVVADKNLVFRS